MEERERSPYALASEAAARLGLQLAAAEVATLASDRDMGDAELGALVVTFDYLAEKRRRASIETLLRLSRLPRREPKTFDGFDLSRIQGRDAGTLAKPSCLIVDEVGRCVFDRACTDLFFDAIDRRYEKEGSNTIIPTSNVAPSSWDEFFTGYEALLCALDGVFDKASVFMMRGPSYRGRRLDTYSVEAVPQATKVRGMQPKGV